MLFYFSIRLLVWSAPWTSCQSRDFLMTPACSPTCWASFVSPEALQFQFFQESSWWSLVLSLMTLLYYCFVAYESPGYLGRSHRLYYSTTLANLSTTFIPHFIPLWKTHDSNLWPSPLQLMASARDLDSPRCYFWTCFHWCCTSFRAPGFTLSTTIRGLNFVISYEWYAAFR